MSRRPGHATSAHRALTACFSGSTGHTPCALVGPWSREEYLRTYSRHSSQTHISVRRLPLRLLLEAPQSDVMISSFCPNRQSTRAVRVHSQPRHSNSRDGCVALSRQGLRVHVIKTAPQTTKHAPRTASNDASACPPGARDAGNASVRPPEHRRLASQA